MLNAPFATSGLTPAPGDTAKAALPHERRAVQDESSLQTLNVTAPDCLPNFTYQSPPRPVAHSPALSAISAQGPPRNPHAHRRKLAEQSAHISN